MGRQQWGDRPLTAPRFTVSEIAREFARATGYESLLVASEETRMGMSASSGNRRRS